MHGVDRSLTEAALIDTHCHLVLLEERGLLAEALEGAHAAGVETIVTIGVNLEDSDRNRVIAEVHPGVRFTVGWDPQQKAPPDAAEQRALGELLQHPRAVAVGEVGLDPLPTGVPRHTVGGAAAFSASHARAGARA